MHCGSVAVTVADRLNAVISLTKATSNGDTTQKHEGALATHSYRSWSLGSVSPTKHFVNDR